MLSSLIPSTPAPGNDNAIKDVTMATFKVDVLEASKQCVVLVDFSMARDPSCKQLTGMLEGIAKASKGTVRLAKVDVERNQQIAQQMGVQSVPSVFAFYQGRPVDAFAGVLPEPQVKAWIDQLIKATGAPVGEEKAGMETALKQASEFLAAKDIATARSIYTDILEMEPANAVAYAGLVRCFLDEGDALNARQVLDAAPKEITKDKALDSVRAALELTEQASAEGGKTAELEAKLAQNGADHQARFDLALAYYAAGRREDAVDQLLEIVRRARSWNDDGARKQLVKFFEAFGAMDPLTLSSRKRLSSILFS